MVGGQVGVVILTQGQAEAAEGYAPNIGTVVIFQILAPFSTSTALVTGRG